MRGFVEDLAFASRMLRRSPGFTVAAVATLAIGIAANTAIFSVVHTVLIRNLPYRDAGRLVRIYETEPTLPYAPVTLHDLIAWRARNRSFESIVSWAPATAVVATKGTPERITAASVTEDYFRTLGVAPALGRDFVASDAKTDGKTSVLLSYGVWQRIFGGDSGVVGRNIVVDGDSCTVIGIMPQRFRPPQPWGDAGLWYPMALRAIEQMRGTHDRWALGRLRNGVTLEQARAEMALLAKQLEREYPSNNAQIGSRVDTLKESETQDARTTLLVTMTAVGFVLLIACENVANLLLARGISRRHEFGVRAALGATRFRLARQLFAEALLLALIAGVLGTLLAVWSVDVIRTQQAFPLPRMDELQTDVTFLAAAGAVTIGAALIFGFAPIWQVARRSIEQELRDWGSRAATGGSRVARVRSALVVSEIALSVVLLVGAGLMLRTITKLLDVNAGFEAEHVLSAEVQVPATESKKAETLIPYTRRLVERVRSIPGVISASTTSKLPLRGGLNGGVVVEGQPEPQGAMTGPLVEFSSVLPDYFRTMGIPLEAGRTFEEADVRPEPQGVIVNRAFVRKFIAEGNPIGKRVSHAGENPHHWMPIIGVVGNTRQWGLTTDPLPEIYFPTPDWRTILVVRSALDTDATAAALRREIAAFDKNLPALTIEPMEGVLAQSLAPYRNYGGLFAIFAAVAVALAAIGIYGLLSFAVNQRRHEIGIRMALGASGANVTAMVLGESSKLIGAGLAVGTATAMVLTKFLESLLFGVTRFDPATLTGVCVASAAVAVAASLIPARRAASIEPSKALRQE